MKRFRALDIDFGSIGLLQDGAGDFAYFCTPTDAEYVGRIGCDGVHFILLPGDERVFCVDPDMGKEGKFVLPVASDFQEFLSFLLSCHDANPLSQIWWMTEEHFRVFEAEETSARQSGEHAELYANKDAALAAIVKEFGLAPIDPFEKVKALQAAFDPSGLNWSDEYYDVLGLENPRHPGEEMIQGTAFAVFTCTREDAMLPKDPNILLSFVNTKLRDEYPSLEALCGGLDADKAALTETLAGLGYAYDEAANQFKPV